MRLFYFGSGYRHWCPACNCLHYIKTVNDEQPAWNFDGNEDCPSFNPSVKISVVDPNGEWPDMVCHYFITNGQIHYCSDSTHIYSGKVIELPDIPEYSLEYYK